MAVEIDCSPYRTAPCFVELIEPVLFFISQIDCWIRHWYIRDMATSVGTVRHPLVRRWYRVIVAYGSSMA